MKSDSRPRHRLAVITAAAIRRAELSGNSWHIRSGDWLGRPRLTMRPLQSRTHRFRKLSRTIRVPRVQSSRARVRRLQPAAVPPSRRTSSEVRLNRTLQRDSRSPRRSPWGHSSSCRRACTFCNRRSSSSGAAATGYGCWERFMLNKALVAPVGPYSIYDAREQSPDAPAPLGADSPLARFVFTEASSLQGMQATP